MSNQDTVIIGVEHKNVIDIASTLDIAQDDCFDFVVVPLYHPQFKRDLYTHSNAPIHSLPGTRSDMVISSGKWNKFIVGSTSDWIDLDSQDDSIRSNSELVC